MSCWFEKRPCMVLIMSIIVSHHTGWLKSRMVLRSTLYEIIAKQRYIWEIVLVRKEG